MKSFLEMWGITICGAITSVLTALGVLLVYKLVGINIYTFSMWAIIPVGAIAVGMAAASGYYFGGLYFHRKPNWLFLVQMILIAGLTQYLIYYLEYSTLVFDDGTRASDVASFAQYFEITTTKAHYRMGRAAHVDTGEVGSFGYWLAAFQFVGFLLGGFSVYAMLRAQPVCEKCAKYFRLLGKRERVFTDSDGLAEYYDNLWKLPPDSPEFSDLLTQQNNNEKDAKAKITHSLFGCPECKAQMVKDLVEVIKDKEWKELSQFTRRILLPSEVSILPLFVKKKKQLDKVGQ